MTAIRRLTLAGTACAAVVVLGGCVVAPPAYGPYGEAAVVAPPVSVDIGVGGYYGRPYYARPYYGRPYYGRPGYYGRGYGGGRPYWR